MSDQFFDIFEINDSPNTEHTVNNPQANDQTKSIKDYCKFIENIKSLGTSDIVKCLCKSTIKRIVFKS